jgi:hypothetical protein
MPRFNIFVKETGEWLGVGIGATREEAIADYRANADDARELRAEEREEPVSGR